MQIQAAGLSEARVNQTNFGMHAEVCHAFCRMGGQGGTGGQGGMGEQGGYGGQGGMGEQGGYGGQGYGGEGGNTEGSRGLGGGDGERGFGGGMFGGGGGAPPGYPGGGQQVCIHIQTKRDVSAECSGHTVMAAYKGVKQHANNDAQSY